VTLTVGSLFSGIGGLDLGLERAGMQVIWQSEIDPYACRVLAKHWPEVPNHGDIKLINWGDVVRPDVICGGYPCQPFSTAGKRNGTDDPRHLWPWVRDCISALRPRYAVLENVRGHLSLGGAEVVGELAAIGYDAEWRVVSAASVGANHRRDRVIIVAYPNGSSGQLKRERQVSERHVAGCCPTSDLADTEVEFGDGGGHRDAAGTVGQRSAVQGSLGGGCGEIPDPNGDRGWGIRSLANGRNSVFGGQTELRGKNGYAGWEWWETEPDVGRVANGVPNRVDRLRGLGNAVVPQVAEVIGRLVVAHHERNTCSASTS
jgi:DNA (cytosine-5)-methyltransferase 1